MPEPSTSEPESAGAAVRRLLPVVVLAGLALGAARYLGEELDLVSARVGDVLLVIATTLLVAWLVFFFARVVDREEAKRRRAEQAEAAALPELEARAAELEAANAELADAKARLERSNEELQRFATVASHDLREPLRVVSGYADLLGRRYRDRLDDDAATFIDAISGGVARMDAMISDLLAYARAGRHDAPREEVDLDALVHGTLATLDVAIREAGAEVHVDPLPAVTGDPRALGQLFQNLIANAVKFTGDEPPRVRIWAAEVPGAWRISIRDNGIGIRPEDAEKIFGMFARLHSSERYPGTGVGLAVCQRIVEAHGGRIWVEPAPGGGSQFMFTLADPRRSAPAPQSAPT